MGVLDPGPPEVLLGPNPPEVLALEPPGELVEITIGPNKVGITAKVGCDTETLVWVTGPDDGGSG